jgi:hypothetical protein
MKKHEKARFELFKTNFNDLQSLPHHLAMIYPSLVRQNFMVAIPPGHLPELLPYHIRFEMHQEYAFL